MGPYGPYKSLCVLMDSNGTLWILLRPYASISVFIGPSLWVFIGPTLCV